MLWLQLAAYAAGRGNQLQEASGSSQTPSSALQAPLGEGERTVIWHECGSGPAGTCLKAHISRPLTAGGRPGRLDVQRCRAGCWAAHALPMAAPATTHSRIRSWQVKVLLAVPLHCTSWWRGCHSFLRPGQGLPEATASVPRNLPPSSSGAAGRAENAGAKAEAGLPITAWNSPRPPAFPLLPPPTHPPPA